MKPNDFDLQKGSAKATEKLLVRLEDTSGIDSVSMLKKLTAAWLRHTIKLLNIPMPPRNVQSITFLLASNWLKEKVESQNGCTKKECSSFIAQVGTGEGKSLVIAMMACFAVKSLGKKVHVLENNEGLLQRDHENFKFFFKQMDVTTSCGVYDAEVDIIYLLRKTIEQSYRRRVFEGHVPPFPDTILIVDEVDELIVDGDPNSRYVKEDIEQTAGFSEAVTLISRGAIGGTGHLFQPTRPDNIKAAVWNAAEDACREADRKNEGDDYVVTSDGVEMCKQGKRTGHTSTWLRVLRQRIHGTSATRDSTFFVQNISHMFGQYQAIMGLSGSLGSPCERTFLKEIFRAEFVETPSFLDTCDGVTKGCPTLVTSNNNVSGTVTIHSNENQQFEDAIALATEYQKKVPVVIVCENPIIARFVYDKLQQCASPNNKNQLLLEYDGSNGRMDCGRIVDNATKPIEQDGTSKSWCITVTDYFGGRGHDYRINDEDVDADGGLLMIGK